MERPEIIYGKTIKLRLPNSEHAYYLTVNFLDGKPMELFINTKDSSYFDWIIGFTRTFSALLRKEQDIQFLLDELKQIETPTGNYFTKVNEKRFRAGSLMAHIAIAIESLVKT